MSPAGPAPMITGWWSDLGWSVGCAVSGMVVGITFTAGYIIYFKFIEPDLNTADNWLWGISPEGIGTVGMVLNFAVAITVAKFTPAPPPRIQELVEDIRVPEAAS